MTDSDAKPDLCNCLAIRKAARHATHLYDRCLAPAGLRTTQFSVLARLAKLGPRTINELAADLAMDRTTMGRNIRPLERDGLLGVATDPRDRRSRALSITEAGRARVAEARALWVVAQQRFEAGYGAERSRDLRQTLAHLVASEFPPADSDRHQP